MTVNIEKIAQRKWTQNNIADYKNCISVDGEGFRCSLYVSGCLFNCPGCYNKSIQNFKVGRPYTQELEDKIISDLSKPYIQGLTFLGGEPMLNPDICIKLGERFRKEFGHSKDIWSWTGYRWEELMKSISIHSPMLGVKQEKLLNLLDVLVDGRYIEAQKDTTGTIKYRGSWNQRIINVPETLKTHKIVEHTEFY